VGIAAEAVAEVAVLAPFRVLQFEEHHVRQRPIEASVDCSVDDPIPPMALRRGSDVQG
jgi:hypothetical protein